MMGPPWILVPVGMVVLLALCGWYSIRVCPANRLLLVRNRWSGSGDEDTPTRVHRGGVHLVWPFLQECVFLDLSPMTVEVDLTECTEDPVQQPTGCSFRACFNNVTEADSAYVSRRYGRMSREDVRGEVHSIVSAVVREALSCRSTSEINEDRNAFVVDVRQRAQQALSEEGMQLLTVSLR